jgi:hypothetical protein
MPIRQLRFHNTSGTTWIVDGVWRTEIPIAGSGGFSQANLINALLQDSETQDKRTVAPPGSVFVIQALKNADAFAAGLSAFAVTIDGVDEETAARIWNSPADDPDFPALEGVAPDDDCAWAAA